MQVFCQKPLTIFCKTLHLRFLTGFFLSMALTAGLRNLHKIFLKHWKVVCKKVNLILLYLEVVYGSIKKIGSWFALRKKCPYMGFFWSVLSHIWTAYRYVLGKLCNKNPECRYILCIVGHSAAGLFKYV